MSDLIAFLLIILAAAGTTLAFIAIITLSCWVMLRSPSSPDYTWATLQEVYAVWMLPLPDLPSQIQGETDF